MDKYNENLRILLELIYQVAFDFKRTPDDVLVDLRVLLTGNQEEE